MISDKWVLEIIHKGIPFISPPSPLNTLSHHSSRTLLMKVCCDKRSPLCRSHRTSTSALTRQKILLLLILDTQEKGSLEINSRIQSIQQIRQGTKIQDGHFSSDYSSFGTGRLVLGPRPSGFLFPYFNLTVPQMIPQIYPRTGPLPVLSTPLRAIKSIVQVPLRSGSSPMLPEDHDLPLSG